MGSIKRVGPIKFLPLLMSFSLWATPPIETVLKYDLVQEYQSKMNKSDKDMIVEIKTALKDNDFLKGLKMAHSKKTVEYRGKKIKVHNQEPSLEYFKQSNSDIAAFYGTYILLGELRKNKVAREKYLKHFSSVLHRKNYCFGTLAYIETISSLPEKIMELKNSKNCTIGKGNEWVTRALSVELARAEALLKWKQNSSKHRLLSRHK